MSAKTPNKVTRLARITAAITGIQQFFGAMQAIVLGGKSYSPSDLVALLQQVAAAITQSSNQKAAWLASVQVERNQIAAIGPVLRYLKAFAITQFGDTQDAAQKLDVLGFAPRKVPVKTAEVKAAAAEKATTTRTSRGTTGKKSKAQPPVTTPEPLQSGPAAAPAAKPTT